MAAGVAKVCSAVWVRLQMPAKIAAMRAIPPIVIARIVVAPCSRAIAPRYGLGCYCARPGSNERRLFERLRFGVMRYNEMCGRSAATDHQVVTVHHFGAATESQNRRNIGGRAALDLFRIGGVVGDEAAADLGAVRPADDDRVAARKRAIDPDHACRQ